MSEAGFVAVGAEPYLTWWCDRFDIDPGAFAGLSCYQRGKRSVWIGHRDVRLTGLSPVDGVGIPFLRVGGAQWKATTAAAVRFGHLASRQVVELVAAEAAALLRGQAVPLGPGDPRRAGHDGSHVIVRYRGVGLGCARWLDGELASEIPRGRQSEASDVPEFP